MCAKHYVQLEWLDSALVSCSLTPLVVEMLRGHIADLVMPTDGIYKHTSKFAMICPRVRIMRNVPTTLVNNHMVCDNVNRNHVSHTLMHDAIVLCRNKFNDTWLTNDYVGIRVFPSFETGGFDTHMFNKLAFLMLADGSERARLLSTEITTVITINKYVLSDLGLGTSTDRMLRLADPMFDMELKPSDLFKIALTSVCTIHTWICACNNALNRKFTRCINCCGQISTCHPITGDIDIPHGILEALKNNNDTCIVGQWPIEYLSKRGTHIDGMPANFVGCKNIAEYDLIAGNNVDRNISVLQDHGFVIDLPRTTGIPKYDGLMLPYIKVSPNMFMLKMRGKCGSIVNLHVATQQYYYNVSAYDSATKITALTYPMPAVILSVVNDEMVRREFSLVNVTGYSRHAVRNVDIMRSYGATNVRVPKDFTQTPTELLERHYELLSEQDEVTAHMCKSFMNIASDREAAHADMMNVANSVLHKSLAKNALFVGALE
jgi:hypothetical protein